MLAPVDIPLANISQQTWIIAQWTFRRDGQSGTTAEIVLMPPAAFSVEPTAINNETFQIWQAEQAAEAAAALSALGPTPPPVDSSLPGPPNAGSSKSVNQGYGL